MRTVIHDRLVSHRRWLFPSQTPRLSLLMLALTLLAALAGCTVTSPSGKITYSAHFTAVTQPAVDAPTAVHFTANAGCSAGEVVQAGIT